MIWLNAFGPLSLSHWITDGTCEGWARPSPGHSLKLTGNEAKMPPNWTKMDSQFGKSGISVADTMCIMKSVNRTLKEARYVIDLHVSNFNSIWRKWLKVTTNSKVFCLGINYNSHILDFIICIKINCQIICTNCCLLNGLKHKIYHNWKLNNIWREWLVTLLTVECSWRHQVWCTPFRVLIFKIIY